MSFTITIKDNITGEIETQDYEDLQEAACLIHQKHLFDLDTYAEQVGQSQIPDVAS